MLGFLQSVIHSLILLISYISGQSSFPPTLTKDEEAECLRCMAGDDEEAGNRAINKLIEHNLRLVAHVAKKYQNSANCRSDSEDLLSIGTIGLIKGVKSFDASKGTRLATYAARCVENEILMMLRSKKKSRGDVSLSDPIGTDKEGNAIMLMDIIENSDSDIFDKIQTKESTKKLYENLNTLLTEREKKIIVLRYGLLDGNCLTQREIADMLGISRSYISRIEKKAVQKLRDGIAV